MTPRTAPSDATLRVVTLCGWAVSLLLGGVIQTRCVVAPCPAAKGDDADATTKGKLL